MIEFDIVKFPKNISSKDGVSREFIEIDSNGYVFKKMSTSETWIFLYFFQSISYNTVVDRKQIYFSPHF